MRTSLKKQYAEALVDSGLVDSLPELLALDPLPCRFSEGEHICRRGEKADRLWVIVSGSIAIRDDARTLYVRGHPEIIGELNILGGKGIRRYDLVANESMVELLTIRKEAIADHPRADILWRNIARIVALKLTAATAQTSSLLEQIQDDAHILRAYTNKYALSRRLGSGSRFLTDHRVEDAVVWFSDIVNFTRSVMELPPVHTADLVQRFFNAQAEAIECHRGYIDKFMGDGLMAFWILPAAGRENCAEACEEALAAAEEAVRSVSLIHVDTKPLELRVGLHTGCILSGDFGSTHRHQFTLIGAAVNKAAQLEQIHEDQITDGGGKPGPVRISSEFRDALPGPTQQRYIRRNRAMTRKLGKLKFYTTAPTAPG
ncbi:MAG: cyclic nucleotide-binding domain-containing protein [Proteobacteria bacterium]|nr:cyclic nucleotide-binding domain-containing protein [Pseudomonadota bacterium]